MASTFSQLKIELIGTGDQAGTWGNTTNVNLGTAIEEAITGTANVTFSNTNVAIGLIDVNTTQTARNLRLNLTGTISAQRHLFVPAIEKQYLVNNGLTFPVVIANGSNSAATGTTFTLPAGRSSIVFNDGTNINDVVTFVSSLGNVAINGGTGNALVLSNVSIVSGNANNITSNASTFSNVSIVSGRVNNITSNASTFSNVSIISGNVNNITSNASTFSNVSILSGNINGVTSNASTLTNATITTSTVNGGTANGVQSSNVVIVSGTVGNTTINAYTEAVLSIGNTGNAVTLNIANATVLTATLTANCTFTMPTDQAGKSFILMLKTGNGGFTSTFVDVQWANGNTAPTITNTASRMDILTFIADGVNWYGNYSQNYPA